MMCLRYAEIKDAYSLRKRHKVDKVVVSIYSAFFCTYLCR